ncbi:MAG: sugar transferase [Pseudonocardiaceae bacterium]
MDVGGVTVRNGDVMNFPAPLSFADRSLVLLARWEPAARRTVDLLVVSVALLVLAIPMLLVAMAIRLGTQGPALYRQQRVGLGGRPFTMYKFRTMRVGGSDAQHRELIARELRGEDTSVRGSWKIDSDPRVTRIGSFLRRTSVDELPQLLNVLLGQMALVGPRPCLEWEAEMFPRKYAERFDVMPGLTGLWQVSGRSTMGTMEMLELDLSYARNWSFWTDLTILVRTVPTLLRGHGAR